MTSSELLKSTTSQGPERCQRGFGNSNMVVSSSFASDFLFCSSIYCLTSFFFSNNLFSKLLQLFVSAFSEMNTESFNAFFSCGKHNVEGISAHPFCLHTFGKYQYLTWKLSILGAYVSNNVQRISLFLLGFSFLIHKEVEVGWSVSSTGYTTHSESAY